MCWNAEVSLNTFIFALFGFAFGAYNQFNWRLLLIGIVFSSMQFIEYNLWKNLKNPAKNAFWSEMGRYVVWAEFFAAANVIENEKYRTIFFGLSAAYILIQMFINRNKTNILTTVGPSRHLVHNWYTDVHWFNYIMPFLLIIPFWIQGDLLWAGFITTTALLSILINDAFAGEFSSLWCYLSTFFWFLVIFKSIGLDKKCMGFFT